MPQEWDEKGNLVTAAQSWDEHGNPVSVQGPATSIGPDNRGLLQKANDWYTRKPSYEGTLDAPGRSVHDKVQQTGQALAAGALPVGMIAAPLPTAMGIAGAAGGGYLGKKAGETVGAPELGEDIGGLAGGFLGGSAGKYGVPRIAGAIGDAARTPYGPNSLAAGGGSSALKPGLRSALKVGRLFGLPEVTDALIPERSAGPTGPYSRISNTLSEGQQPKIAGPSPFPGATSSSAPGGNAELPPVPKGNPTPFPQIQGKIAPPTGRSAIIDPNNIPPDEVTHQSVPWDQLKAQAIRGDKFAIDEVIRRGREAEIPGLAGVVGRAKPYPRIGR